MLETFHHDGVPLGPLCLAEEVTRWDMPENVDELMILFSQVELLP
jgi:hypothetical protein